VPAPNDSLGDAFTLQDTFQGATRPGRYIHRRPHFIAADSPEHTIRIGPVLAFTQGMRVIDLIRRLRHEFTAMPGLRLTELQVERLCTADASTSAAALEALVIAGFLSLTRDGRYGRADLLANASSKTLVRERARIMPSPWRRILCLVELDNDSADVLTTAASSALRYATALAVNHRARITALQVVAHHSSQPVSVSVSDALRKSAFGKPFCDLIDVRVASGSPDEQVMRVAKDVQADLIVIGRGSGRNDESLSWLPETLQQAPCPVLIVHPSGRAAVA
jgi:nucleotide-binding universal stress UspA family protein